MPDPDHKTYSQAEYGSGSVQIVRYSMPTEYDVFIINRTQEAIQRSRELLKSTSHQAFRASQPADHSSSASDG
ncbi:hypothetical protein [Methylorubrum populi]